MRKKNITPSSYQVYDLSDSHFQNAEIITEENKSIKGQFVKFKVVTENKRGYQMYPSEKFCFLPLENKKEFWDTCQINNGVFNELPAYIKEMGLDDIKKIIIEPLLIS